MAKASSAELTQLKTLMAGQVEGLPKTECKRMFGCDGFFAGGKIFALVWKEGRIGLRFEDEEVEKKLGSLKGAAPWKAGKMTMSHWVLVPTEFHASKAELKRWVKQAHAAALASPPAKKTKSAKT